MARTTSAIERTIISQTKKVYTKFTEEKMRRFGGITEYRLASIAKYNRV